MPRAPQLSPDGKFYWTGAAWARMPSEPSASVFGRALMRVRKDLGWLPAPNNGANPPPQIEQALYQQGMDPTRPFSPGRPLNPYFGISAAPRQWDFRTGVNITARPRNNRVSFETLRDITAAYDVARMCIDRRIDSFRSFERSIVPADGDSSNVREEILEARKAMAKPDGKTPYATWIAKLLEGLFRYDAPALYKRRDRIGRVIGLAVVDGSTIAPLLDEYGYQPEPPAPAFIQYVNGVPWDWLTSDDMIYLPYRPQPDSPYGRAPMENMLLNANSDLRLQQHWLENWTEGSIPGAFAEAPEDMSSPAEVEELQDVWDAKVESDQSRKVQVRWVPHGTNMKPFYDQKFDEPQALWMMCKTCAAYSVVPQDLGLTMDVNRSSGETQVDIQERIADRPLALHIDGILTDYLQNDLGLPVKHVTSLAAEKEDRLVEARAWQIYVNTGMASADEGRQKLLGLEIDNERPVPRFILNPRTGPIPLESLYAIAGPIDPETAAPSEAVALTDEQYSGADATLPDKLPGGTQFKRAPVNPDDPNFPSNQVLKPETGMITPPAQATAPTPPAAAAVAPPATAVRKDANKGLLAAGLVVRAADTGRVLMLQRSLSENDPAAGYWEFPGGKLEGSESTWETAWREWQEETGCSVPDGEPGGTWTVGIYQGFIWEIPHESDLEINLQSGRTINPDDPDQDAIEVAAWFDPLDARDMPALRPECRLTDWNLVAGRIPALKSETAGITADTGIVGVDLVGDDDDDEADDEESDAEEVQKELRRWRDSARKSVKAGRHAREFTYGIPSVVRARIWESLQSASTREEVDAAFSGRPKVRKAASSRPFLKHIKAAEKHYHGGLVAALRFGLDPEQIARKWASSPKPVKKADIPEDLKQAARMFAGNLPTDPAALKVVLEALYAEGSVIGAKEALELLRSKGADVTLIGLSAKADALNWDQWTAGNAGAASELAGLDGGAGLTSLLDQSGVTIKSIVSTRLDELGSVLADGAAKGSSVDSIAGDIRGLLDDPLRAELIANTELNRAVTASTLSTYKQNGIAQWDLLVFNPCPDCEDVEAGNPHDLGEDGPPIHPGCLLGATRVVVPGDVERGLALHALADGAISNRSALVAPAMTEAPRNFTRGQVRAATNRHYVGYITTIELACGYQLSGTANHPIATPRGWMTLAELQVGDDVFRSTAPEWTPKPIDPDVDHVPPTIKEIAQALPVGLGIMPTAPEDFHGDGSGSDVHVIRTNGLLLDEIVNPSFFEHGDEESLTGRDVAEGALDAERMAFLFGQRHDPAADRLMRSRRELTALGGGHLSHTEIHGRALVAGLDALTEKATSDEIATNSELLRDGLLADTSGIEASHLFVGGADEGASPLALKANAHEFGGQSPQPTPAQDFAERFGGRVIAPGDFLATFPSDIVADRIVHVSRRWFSGHVYNLDTENGWYIGNGIITHNCRCAASPHLPEEV